MRLLPQRQLKLPGLLPGALTEAAQCTAYWMSSACSPQLHDRKAEINPASWVDLSQAASWWGQAGKERPQPARLMGLLCQSQQTMGSGVHLLQACLCTGPSLAACADAQQAQENLDWGS